jgi:hypothetical protein
MSKNLFLARYGSEKHIREIERTKSYPAEYRYEMQFNPTIPSELVDKFAQTSPEFIKHPNLSKEGFDHIVKNDNGNHRRLIRRSPHLTLQHIKDNPELIRPGQADELSVAYDNPHKDVLDHIITPELAGKFSAYDVSDISTNKHLTSDHISTMLKHSGHDQRSVVSMIDHPSFTKENAKDIPKGYHISDRVNKSLKDKGFK